MILSGIGFLGGKESRWKKGAMFELIGGYVNSLSGFSIVLRKITLDRISSEQIKKLPGPCGAGRSEELTTCCLRKTASRQPDA
ncbi:hypothetical protein GCM10010946_30830 [Undibacterium squillarum]|uniref:Uncharacterized protein n=1 Tax=Undibacterium squillarum TaxID=1131567 RepID=A0ABQ2Y1M2_9BURK|nr:hypothetical protein GCM10010946_30830 [Undibacterium squillarum]